MWRGASIAVMDYNRIQILPPSSITPVDLTSPLCWAFSFPPQQKKNENNNNTWYARQQTAQEEGIKKKHNAEQH